jgi:hypothetical protein
MPLSDVVKAALGRPAGKVVEAPVRDLVHEIIRDHGFLGPAEGARLREEIAALRDRVQGLEQKLAEAQAAPAAPANGAPSVESVPADRLTHLEARAKALEQAAARMEKETDRLVRFVEGVLADRPVARTGDPAVRGCQVDGCKQAHHRLGFCAEHHGKWKAGKLSGFVGPEGIVTDGGETWRVDAAHAGRPFEVKWKGKTKKVHVAGAAVEAAPANS